MGGVVQEYRVVLNLAPPVHIFALVPLVPRGWGAPIFLKQEMVLACWIRCLKKAPRFLEFKDA